MPRRGPPVKEVCAVRGCDEEGVKSLPKKKLENVFGKGGIEIKGRRAKVCKKHYKEYKKETKEDRTLERLGW